MAQNMKFYRYILVQYASSDEGDEPLFPSPKLELSEYDLYKETSKGYWIGFDSLSKYKWIPKSSKKRFAYPTKQEALNNFIMRTKRRIKILDWQASSSRVGLDLAMILKPKL